MKDRWMKHILQTVHRLQIGALVEDAQQEVIVSFIIIFASNGITHSLGGFVYIEYFSLFNFSFTFYLTFRFSLSGFSAFLFQTPSSSYL